MGGYYLIVLEDIGWKVAGWILLAKERNQRQLLLTPKLNLGIYKILKYVFIIKLNIRFQMGSYTIKLVEMTERLHTHSDSAYFDINRSMK